MANTQALTLDFLEWLAAAPRPYRDVMEAWRTSCPRLSIWEDALAAGYVARGDGPGAQQIIRLTPAGQAFLQTHRRSQRGECDRVRRCSD